MVLSQEDKPRTAAQSVKCDGRQRFQVICNCPHHTKRICSWNALRGDVRNSWLLTEANGTARKLLLKKFSSLTRTSSSLQMKMCSLFWLQQWKNCENRLRFHRVKDNKIKRVFEEYSAIFTKFGLLISRGSAATYLRCVGQCYKHFVAHFTALSSSERIVKIR